MNQKTKEEPKKTGSNTRKPKNTGSRKGGPIKHGKKNAPKTQKQNQNKRPSSQKAVKNSEQKQPPKRKPVPQKKPEVEFISKATLEDEWTIENIERYVLAVRKAFEKIPETEKGEIDLREIWLNSSLPADLILKIISDHGEKVGIKKNSVYLDGKIMY